MLAPFTVEIKTLSSMPEPLQEAFRKLTKSVGLEADPLQETVAISKENIHQLHVNEWSRKGLSIFHREYEAAVSRAADTAMKKKPAHQKAETSTSASASATEHADAKKPSGTKTT